MILLSFHNDNKIKEKYLNRVKEHREADNIIQGSGWINGKGCAIGCTLECYDHYKYPTELGIPVWIAKLEDGIFEGLSNEDAMEWPEIFLESIPVGVDLNKISFSFLAYIVELGIEKVNKNIFKKQYNTIKVILNKLKANKIPTDKEIKSAAAAAHAAYDAYDAHAAIHASYAAVDAAYAAHVAAHASAHSATYSAAHAAAHAAAYSAAHAAVDAAFEDKKTYKKISEKLVELFKGLEKG